VPIPRTCSPSIFGFHDEAIKAFGRYRNAGLWDVNPQTTQTFQRAYERIQGLPGVVSAAGASTPPLAGSLGMGFLIEGRPVPPLDKNGQPSQTASYIAVTPNLLRNFASAYYPGPRFQRSRHGRLTVRGDHQSDHGQALLAE
jgi:hypothetical protein